MSLALAWNVTKLATSSSEIFLTLTFSLGAIFFTCYFLDELNLLFRRDYLLILFLRGLNKSKHMIRKFLLAGVEFSGR